MPTHSIRDHVGYKGTKKHASQWGLEGWRGLCSHAFSSTIPFNSLHALCRLGDLPLKYYFGTNASPNFFLPSCSAICSCGLLQRHSVTHYNHCFLHHAMSSHNFAVLTVGASLEISSLYIQDFLRSKIKGNVSRNSVCISRLGSTSWI